MTKPRCAWRAATVVVLLLSLLFTLLVQSSSPSMFAFVLAVPAAPTSDAPPSDTAAQVRALQATLRHVYQLDALPDPPRTMGVHTACKKFGRACPAEYVVFLQAYKDGLPPPSPERRNCTAGVSAPYTHARAAANTSRDAAAHAMPTTAGKPDRQAAPTLSASGIVVDPRWSYAQLEHLENLRHLITVLEKKVRHVAGSRDAAACALRRAEHAHYDALRQQCAHSDSAGRQQALGLCAHNDLFLLTDQHTPWRSLARCAWHHPLLRCFPAYTLPTVGWRLWSWVVCAVHVVLPWTVPLCLAVLVLERCAWIALGPLWPEEQVALLQYCAASVLTKEHAEPGATVQTDASDATPITAVHNNAATTTTRATTNDSTLSASHAARARRVTAILFALLDEHFACELPCAFVRLRLALYLLIDLAFLLTVSVTVTNTNTLVARASSWVMHAAVRGSAPAVVQWAIQTTQQALARLMPSWLLTLGVVGVLWFYLLRLLRLTMGETMEAHDELLRLDLEIAKRHELWLERLSS